MKDFSEQKRMLPEYPRTLHIPHKANAARNDLLANETEVQILFDEDHVYVEEKVDGANCGMVLGPDGHPIVRNSEHILVKGYDKKKTPAKKQFAPVWTWFYDNLARFQRLQNIGPLSVYGDWMVMQHGMVYDALPDWYLTYDLYNYEEGQFLDSAVSRQLLAEAGFAVVPLRHQGPIQSWEHLVTLAEMPSVYANGTPGEGVYIKVGNGRWTTHRYKMVRQGFQQGSLFCDELKKNKKV